MSRPGAEWHSRQKIIHPQPEVVAADNESA